MKLSDIAARLNCDLVGDGSVEVFGVAGIETAAEGELSFLVNPKYLPQLKHTRASALIVGLGFGPSQTPLLRHENPYLAFAKAIELFNPPRPQAQAIHPTAIISPNALLAQGTSVGA